MQFYDNSYIKEIWKHNNTSVKVISSLNSSGDLLDYTKKFINIRTFPYVNSQYGKIIDEMYNSLPKKSKIEVIGILEKYLHEIEDEQFKQFTKLTDDELVSNFLFDEDDLKQSREDLFKNISGGQYCEMLLFNILISLGYKKIISKLYLEYGKLSPTGIDVPAINIENKSLVFGECKIYKNIKNAISNAVKDVQRIINGDKIEKDLIEWESKFSMIPDEIGEYLYENKMFNKTNLIENVDEINVIAFVLGNQIDETILSDFLKNFSLSNIEKFNIFLIAVPIESKDEFVSYCVEAISDLKKEFEEQDE